MKTYGLYDYYFACEIFFDYAHPVRQICKDLIFGSV